MNTPNPLVPQGSIQSRSNGASNIRIAVVTIVAIHIVFFGGLLLQGCKRDNKKNETAALGGTEQPTNTLSYPPMTDTNSMYYTNASTLPAERTNPIMPSAGLDLGATNYATPEPIVTNRLGGAATASTETKDYIVAKNDSFFKIAKANNITVGALTRANPNADPHKLKVGQKLKIPVSASENGATAGLRNGTEGAGGPGTSYTVKAGDTLTKIAKGHGITVSDLRAANNLKTSKLSVGQKIKIPEKRERTAGNNTATNSGQPKPL
jgi:LysM repeat protein